MTGTFLLCTGSEDPLCTPQQLFAFARALQAAEVDWRVNVYGGAKHAFWAQPTNRDGLFAGGTAHAQATVPGVGYHPAHTLRVLACSTRPARRGRRDFIDRRLKNQILDHDPCTDRIRESGAGRWQARSGDDHVCVGCGAETTVGGDQWKIAHDGQLDVQGVDQPQLMTPRPRADEKVTDIVALDRCSDEVTQPGLDVLGLEVASPMQSSQRRENFGLQVRRCVQRVTPESPTNGATQLVVEQQIHHRGCVDDYLSHGALGLRPARRRVRRGRGRGALLRSMDWLPPWQAKRRSSVRRAFVSRPPASRQRGSSPLS